MIYIDDSEARENTRLPQSVIECSTVLVGLENLTGADILLYEGDIATINSLESIPDKMRFKQMCQEGALIQRKTERDVCRTIVDKDHNLNDALCKMLKWSLMCWLVVDGLVMRVKNNKLAFYNHDDRKYIVTEFDYSVYVSATLGWMYPKGGYFYNISNVNDWPLFINLVLDKMAQAKNEPEKQIVHHKVYQKLNEADWRDTWATFPHVGTKRAVEWARKTFIDTLLEWTTPNGSKAVDDIRKYIGMPEGSELRLLKKLNPDCWKTGDPNYDIPY
jgi:hypothetical protein